MTAVMGKQHLLVRSKGSLEVCTLMNGIVSGGAVITREPVKQIRANATGTRLAIGHADGIALIDFTTTEEGVREVCKVPVICQDLCLSPSGRYLATFEKLNASADGQSQHFNLKFWKIDESSSSVRQLGAFSHKLQSTWMPQWTTDESHLGRMSANEVQFFKAEVLEKPAFKIQLDNIGAFSISPGSYPKAAVFIKEAKGQPGAVKVFLLPNTGTPVAQKMFFKADRCTIQWSPNGKHLLALAQTEVDSTGVSYYGETHLYFVSGDGSFDCRVTLDKEGPIHDVAWSPASNEFVVLYGYMPSKAMLFDLRCEAVYEFPVGSKNHIRWNPQGTLLCFGGFGNLPGHVEIWSRHLAEASGEIRRIGCFQSQGSSVCEWGPDGLTLLTAIVTPRLRVDNGYKIWSWNGQCLGKATFDELYGTTWRMPKCDKAIFPGLVDPSQARSVTPGQPEQAVKKEAYRPPGLRHLSPSSQAAKDSATSPATPASSSSTQSTPASTMTKEERAVKKLKVKLDQIAILKDKMNAGESLELNQVEKIKREDEVRKEYEQALIAMKNAASARK